MRARTGAAGRCPREAPRYAIDDVSYLLPAWRHLESAARDAWPRHWLARGQAGESLAEPPVADADRRFGPRLKGVFALPPRGQAAALALVRWREDAAQRADRPRRWLLADETFSSSPRSCRGRRTSSRTRAADVRGAPRRRPARGGRAPRRSADCKLSCSRALAPQAPDKTLLKALQEKRAPARGSSSGSSLRFSLRAASSPRLPQGNAPRASAGWLARAELTAPGDDRAASRR